MNHDVIQEFELVFLLLLACVVVFALVARKLGVPYPIVLVVAGLLIGFIPAMPAIKLEPDVVFLVILPPLLYHSAWVTSWREFRANLVSISTLAFGLVGFTVVAVAFLAPRVLHGFDWRLGFVLGAVVAPTDALAATAIGRRIGLPHRTMALLEGESLLNDASGLLMLEFGTAMVVDGEAPTLAMGLSRLLWLTLGGTAVGLAVGWVVDRFERRVNYGAIEITLSLLVPYTAYLLAEAVHASGVLAVVACGLLVSWRSAEFYAADVRLESAAVWETIDFILNGVTFVLIGLQLPAVWAGIHDYSAGTLITDAIIFTTMLILLRLIWVYVASSLAQFVRRRIFGQLVAPIPSKQKFVLGWTGMRGVIALAAAISLPVTLDNGAPFPHRNVIIFFTFSVILITLVGQGLTLPALVRALDLKSSGKLEEEERQARVILLTTALNHIRRKQSSGSDETARVYEHLAEHYQRRLNELETPDRSDGGEVAETAFYRRLHTEVLQVERNRAIQLRKEGRINDEILRRLQQELDIGEIRLGMTHESNPANIYGLM
jgi:CPA1 family monovalent cation:H+ antiporter